MLNSEIARNADGTDSSITKDVIYTPNQESAKIEYYDETTGKVLSTDTVTGVFGTKSGYNPVAIFESILVKVIKLYQNGFPAGGIDFNNAGMFQLTALHSSIRLQQIQLQIILIKLAV